MDGLRRAIPAKDSVNNAPTTNPGEVMWKSYHLREMECSVVPTQTRTIKQTIIISKYLYNPSLQCLVY